MSSETSTDSLAPWQLFTLAGLLGATLVVFLSRGQTPAGIILLSLTIFSAAVVGVAAWRTLAPFTGGDIRRDRPVIGGRTRAAIEREKTLALRSIKNLEFDRAMGKVSQKDFDEMSARLRSRAARLIGQLDAGAGYRNEIEKEIARRIGDRSGEPAPTSGGGTPVAASTRACPACRTDNDIDAQFCKHCGTTVAVSAHACPACTKDNDGDARFCKHCGANMAAAT
jgi:hypothetical protein